MATKLGSEDQPERVVEAERARIQAVCDKASALLQEQGLDAGIVMVTWQTEDGMTATASMNFGNWHAQNGMMQQLLKKRAADTFVEQEKLGG